jgi:hypothetical protein
VSRFRIIFLAILVFLPVVFATGQDIPPYVDNSATKYFPPIIDQSGGSCAQASSIGYVFTYEVNRLLDRDASASPANRFSYLSAWNLVNDGLNQGGFAEDGLFVAQRTGILTEEDYGSASTYSFKWASGFDKYRNALRYRVSRFIELPDDVEGLKRYLAAGGIVSFSGKCIGWTMDSHYSGPSGTGYKCLLIGLPDSGAHAMTIVGYDDLVTYTDRDGQTHTGAFIAVNSWGAYVHDRGRYYYPYDFFLDPSIPSSTLSDKFMAAEVKVQEPQILFRLTLDYSSRNDLAYHIGGTADVPKGIPDNYYFQSGMSNKGGDHAMRGANDKSPLEFALDLTDNIPGEDFPYCRYFLKIIRSAIGKEKGEGSLTALSVIDYRGGKPVEHKYSGPLPRPLVDGENVFVIGLVPRFTVSCSPVRAKEDIPFYMRTAKGDEARMTLKRDGRKVTVQYQVKK